MVDRIDDQVEAVSDRVATFIVENLRWDGPKQALLAADPVQLPAVLDSSDLFELAGYLEQTFSIEIDNEEIVVENFANVRRLAELIVDKQSGAGPG
jgi:acyl carrier protein